MKKYILATLLILSGFLSATYCQCEPKVETELQKRSRFFITYMQQTFPNYEVKDGEYLFILPHGCLNCNKATCYFLSQNPSTIKDRYNAVLISQSTLEGLPIDISSIDANFLVDKTDKLDRMAFGITGISVLKIKDKQIVSSKSMTVENLQNGIETFFGN